VCPQAPQPALPTGGVVSTNKPASTGNFGRAPGV